MKLHRVFCLFVFLTVTSGSSAFAQIAADIRGRVLDASGAAVAHAQVELTESATNVHQSDRHLGRRATTCSRISIRDRIGWM